ncbi:MAG: DUF4835 family protein [Saprospiraceae bacterium]|nr:DUF4835 family protein [Lewinella sp.]
MSRLALILLSLIISIGLQAQELNANVKVNTQKLQTVDPKVFETLEQTIQEFLNNQKWTSDVFELEERINCNFILTIQEELSPTSFKADLAVQSSRPVYMSEYETPLFNYIDKEVTFYYEQYQPIQYSRNQYNDNLSAVLAYYAFIIIGKDYDSFSPMGGEPYFQLAQDILNSVPQSAASSNPGWRSVEGNRNRYWLVENIMSPRVRPMRQAMYAYHRDGLDVMFQDVETGRAVITQALSEIGSVNQSYPNSMIVQLFNNEKSAELVEIYKLGSLEQQNEVIRLMSRLDPANASKYRAIK